MPVMVPAEVLPSPQVMVAVYDAALPNGSGLVNVATVPVKGAPAVALKLTPVADNGSGVDRQAGAARAGAEAGGAGAARRAAVGGGDGVAAGVQRRDAEGGLAVGVEWQRGADGACCRPGR